MTQQKRPHLVFYSLLLTQTFSLIGSQMTALALGIWVYAETGSAAPLTLVAFFTFLPRLLSASFAGLVADRYDRRYVMALSDAGQAIGTLFLLGTFLTGTFQVWHLYVVATIQAIFGVLQQPAFQASVTQLIPDNQRDRANAIQMLNAPLAGVIAPAFAGALYGLVGIIGVIVVDLVTFAVGVLVVLFLDIPKPQKSVVASQMGESFWAQAFAGLRYVWQTRPLFWLFFFMGCNNFFIAGIQVLRTPYILARTDNDAVLVGLLMSVGSIGAIVGTLVMSTWGGFRPRIRNVLPSAAIIGVMYAFLGTQSTPFWMGVAIFFSTMFPPIINASLISILQIKVPNDLQGRVFAAIQQMSMTLMPLSYLLSGPLADRVFEPAANTDWFFGAIVGSGAGAGMGLMHVINGLIVAGLSISFYRWHMVRDIEKTLPDYVPQQQVA